MRNVKTTLLAGIASIAAIAGLALCAEHKLAVSKSFAAGGAAAEKKGANQDLAKAKATMKSFAQPLAFEENRGQTDSQVKFLAHAKGYTAYFTPRETVLRVGESVLRMRLKGGSAAPAMQGQDLQIGKSNYLLGKDRSKWITDVPHYAEVRYRDAYPGIDAVYSGDERQLEYNFVVRAGADPSLIRMSFDGAGKLALNRAGDLEVRTGKGMVIDHKPAVYQTVDGRRRPVSGEFTLLAKNEVGFKLGVYDTRAELVIDPTVVIGANVGGTSNDEGFGIAATSIGNTTFIVLTGRTMSVNSGGTPGAPGIAATGFPALGPVTVTSTTTSTAPIEGQHAPGANWDAFVTEFQLNSAGIPNLIYSTFIGTNTDEAGEGVVVDASGDVYVTGYTDNANLVASTSGVAFSGVYDAFVAELNPAGSAISSATYLGGVGSTQAFSIALDPTTQNLVIGGLTNGIAPAPAGAQTAFGGGQTDGFVASFAPTTLALVKATYLGGSGYDQVNSVTVDSTGNIYAAGLTNSQANTGIGCPAVIAPAVLFPTSSALNVGCVPAGQQTAFATKYNNTLSRTSYSTVWGTGGEDANGIAVDVDGIAYIVGATKKTNLTTVATAGGCAVATTVTNPGTLGAQAISNGVAPLTVSASPACVDPLQTQGYLLSIKPPAPSVGLPPPVTVNYLALQAFTPTDPLNAVGCNLNLTKNGGNFASVLNPCQGAVGSWNGVATDSDEQAYVVGQTAVTPQSGDFLRINRVGTPNSTQGPLPLDQNFGTAVINLHRQEYTIGTTTGAVETALAAPSAYEATNLLNPPGGPNIINPAPDSIVNNGGEDVSLVGIDFNDVFIVPSVLTLPTISLGTTPLPFATIQTENVAGVPVNCPGLASTFGGFTITALPSTGTYSVALTSDATPGVFTGQATGFCGLGLDNFTTLNISEIVTGPLNLATSATLTATSVVGSGILQPYNTTVGNATINVSVTTAVGAIPYTASENILTRSPNWPNCGLIFLNGTTVGTATPPVGPTFNININSGCAANLPVGVYSESISVASTTPGEATTQNLAFSLTINPPNGGITVSQAQPNFIFGTSTNSQSGSFSVQNTGASAVTFSVTYAPQDACVIGQNIAPLPLADQVITSGAVASVPPGGTASVNFQITPNNLSTASGVYGYSYAIASPNLPTVFTTCGIVYVGTGIGFVQGGGYRNQGVGVNGATP